MFKEVANALELPKRSITAFLLLECYFLWNKGHSISEISIQSLISEASLSIFAFGVIIYFTFGLFYLLLSGIGLLSSIVFGVPIYFFVVKFANRLINKIPDLNKTSRTGMYLRDHYLNIGDDDSFYRLDFVREIAIKKDLESVSTKCAERTQEILSSRHKFHLDTANIVLLIVVVVSTLGEKKNFIDVMFPQSYAYSIVILSISLTYLFIQFEHVGILAKGNMIHKGRFSDNETASIAAHYPLTSSHSSSTAASAS